MSSESAINKRLRAEPKNYNLNRNYTVKRTKSDSGFVKKKPNNYGMQTTIFDSGGYSIKYGNTNMDCPILMPNCIIKAKAERKRPFIGNQIEDCRDLSGLYYLLPCERGYVTKWDVQKPIWDYIFQQHQIEDHSVIMTQPIFNFRSIQDCMDEIFFEEYEVQSLVRQTTTDLAYFNYMQSDTNDVAPPSIVVDSGFSFSHIVPYIDGRTYYPGTIRIDIGGKLLTNYMKDIISYRQLHVMEETYVINQVKEDACFVSEDLKSDMKIAQQSSSKNSIVCNYVLPDFNNIRRGYIQEPGEALPEIAEGCQILRLNNERFTVPELLLHPSNIGMECMGISEAIVKCIKKCPLKYQSGLAKNIVLIGGNANFPGYKERIFSDVRSMLPYHFQLGIEKPDDPVGYAWLGGKTLSKSPQFEKLVVLKHEYEEYGSNLTYKRFNDMKTTAIEDESEDEEPAKSSLLANIKGRSIFGKHDIQDEEVDVAPEAELTAATQPDEEMKNETEAPVETPETPSEAIIKNMQNATIQLVSLAPQLLTSGTVKINTCSAPSSTVIQAPSLVRTVKKPIDLTNCVTLEDILKAAGNKDIKICGAPGLVRSLPIQGQQNIIRMMAPNGNQPLRQVVRIHHYPPQQAVIKNITFNNPRASVQTQSILRLPVSSTQTLNGQQITILPRSNMSPLLTQLPIAVSTSGANTSQILRLNYTVPKLTAIKPQGQEPATSVLKDLYPTTSTDNKADKTVVLVKQVFLKKT